MKMYPFKFKPIYKQRIWGGQRLREVFDKDIPSSEKIGESWELADLPDDKSIIINGEFAGQTLRAVVEEYPEEVTGDRKFELPFPLLIKLLDAQEILSVQVHPDAAACKQMGKGDPKTECWYIIDARSDAFIYKGLKKGVSRERFAEAIRNGTVETLLVKVPVTAGECHYLPAGTAHSIGAGLLIAEIQTPSDTTYRVYDFNRVDETGKGRQLHIEEALESINFNQDNKELTVRTVGRLVDCEHFKIDKGHQGAGCEVLFSDGQMRTLIFTSGAGKFLSADGGFEEYKAGDCMLIPAVYEGVMKCTEESEYLKITL